MPLAASAVAFFAEVGQSHFANGFVMAISDLLAEEPKISDNCIEPPASENTNPFITPA